eukprot:scaffold1724_cov341-Pavlova_lutheri.AAC.54
MPIKTGVGEQVSEPFFELAGSAASREAAERERRRNIGDRDRRRVEAEGTEGRRGAMETSSQAAEGMPPVRLGEEEGGRMR